MELIGSINSSQMSKTSQTLFSLGSTFYGWDTFPGEINGKIAMFARVYYSWNNLAGGGADGQLVCRFTMLPSSAAATSQAHYMWAHCTVSYGTQFSNFALSPYIVHGGPASGSDYVDVCWLLTNTGGVGELLPLPPYWTLRWSNGGTAFTNNGGTVSLDKVEFYG